MSTDIDIAAPRRLRPLKLAGVVALLAAAAVAATGIATRVHAKEQMAKWSAAQAIPTVVANPPLHDSSAQVLVLPGQLSAYVKAPIYARVSGYLHAWYADIGAHVKAGQLLGDIDTPDLDQQLAQARADLRTSQANETLAASTSRRWTQMLQQDSVSQQETDEKTSDLAAKRAMVAANQANVARLEALESFKRITAPFDGIVTARKTDVGALISAGGGNGPELFTVSDARQLRLYVSVPQNEAAVIRPGLVASLTVPERPGMQFSAKLVDTDDSITPSSGTLLVQLAVDNSSGVLIPGEYTEVHFELPMDNHAMTIPASALMFRESGLQVAVVGPGNHAMLKRVSVATDLGTKIVIASGLTATDRVIDNPPDSLANGDPVRLASTSATTALTQHNEAERSHG